MWARVARNPQTLFHATLTTVKNITSTSKPQLERSRVPSMLFTTLSAAAAAAGDIRHKRRPLSRQVSRVVRMIRSDFMFR